MKKNLIKSAMSVILALALLCTAIPAMFVSADDATTVTAQNAAPASKVFSTTYFTETDLSNNFTAWGGNTAATFSDGVLKLAEKGNVRGSMWYHNTPSLNQTVTASVATSSTSYVGAVVWLRMNEVEGVSDRATGYHIKLVVNGSSATATLYKTHYNDSDTYTNTKIGAFNAVDPKSSSGEYLDIGIRATATYDETAKTTAINIGIYKGTNLMYAKTYEDNESELQVAGHVGVSANALGTVGTATADFTSFGYYTTDNYVTKTLGSISDFENDFMTVNSNTSATVANGEVTIAAGSNNRNTAQFVDSAALNQSVVATVKNPHSLTDGVATYTQSEAIVWLRSNTITRASNSEVAPYGYYAHVIYSSSNANVTVRLYKQPLNADGTDINTVTKFGECSFSTLSSDGTTFLDTTIKAAISYDEAAGTNTITLEPYKGTYHFSTYDMTYTDADFTTAGNAGIAGGTGGATFTQFAATSDLSVASAYAVENTIKADGTMFGQTIWVDPTAKYQFSAIYDGDVSAEPLAFAYRTGASTGTRIDITPATTDVVIDSRYNKLTYTIDMTDYVTSNADNEGAVAVRVGFAINSSTVNSVKYTNFELRKVTDGKLGANLIINGDFKMGGYAWSEDVKVTAWVHTNAAPGSYKKLSSNNRVLVYTDENNLNYWKNFVVDSYEDYMGDANADGNVNVLDLIRVKKNTLNGVYNFYADMDQDGNLNAADITAIIRSYLVPLKNS